MNNNISSKIKALVFCRVSSKEQEDTGYSLDSQEKLLTEYAGKYDYKIAKVYRISESASGKQVRKTFIEALQFATKNKVDVILCEKIDRLTRNLKDAATVDDWVKEDTKRAVHFVKENFTLNQQTRAHDNLVWDMKVAIARFYTNNLSEEVKKGQVEKLAQGWLPTKPPLGYKTTGDKGHKIHVVDEEVAPFMRKMFEWYATGNYSIARVEKGLFEAGMRTRSGKKLGMSRIHVLLQDPFYYGKIRWMDKLYAGKHEPLIAKDVFDKVQILIRRKTLAPHLMKHNALFKSKVFCENCGGMMTWYEKKGHWYGHCNNHGEYAKCSKKVCMRQEAVEEQITGVFDIIAPKNEEVLAAITQILKDKHKDMANNRESDIKRFNTLLANVQVQKDRLYEAKLNKEVPVDYVERKLSELTTEEETIENSLVSIRDKSDEHQAAGIAVHELAFRCKDIYEAGDIDNKRLLLSQLFTNLLQNGREIKKEYTNAASFLMEWMPKLNTDYELQKSEQIKGKDVVLSTSSPIWLGGQDLNLRPSG